MNIEGHIGSFLSRIINSESSVYKNLQIAYRNILSIKKTQKLKKLSFHVRLTEHCNLNCAGCSAFSPVADEKFYDVDVFRNDCERIAALTNGEIGQIVLAGGEPLLHPRITDFFDISRSFFGKYMGGGG
jgi:MoaA/NifB/PqqE/SkfB family radical SAM enzyme